MIVLRKRKCKKTPFHTAQDAYRAMESYNSSPEMTKQAKSYYLCPYCKAWHFTTQKASDNKADQLFHEKRALRLSERKPKRYKYCIRVLLHVIYDGFLIIEYWLFTNVQGRRYIKQKFHSPTPFYYYGQPKQRVIRRTF